MNEWGKNQSSDGKIDLRKKQLFAIGVLFAGLAVGLGALGTHGLEQYLPSRFDDSARRLKAWDNAVFWQAFHAVSLLILTVSPTIHAKSARVSAALFVAGVILFSGFIYVWAVTGIKWLVAIVPVGGTTLLAGWAILLWVSLSTPKRTA